MDSVNSVNSVKAPPPVAFNNNTANARFPFHGSVYIDLLAPQTSGPNEEWALPAQHISLAGLPAAVALRDFLSAAIAHAEAMKLT